MISEHEAEEIARARRNGVGGPIVMKWLDQLLADRHERIRQVDHLRQRLRQAFRYLDGLLRDAHRLPPAERQEAVCPHCGKPPR